MVDTAGQFCIPVLCSVQTSSRGLAWSLGGDGANSAQQIAKTFPPLSLSFSFSLFFSALWPASRAHLCEFRENFGGGASHAEKILAGYPLSDFAPHYNLVPRALFPGSKAKEKRPGDEVRSATLHSNGSRSRGSFPRKHSFAISTSRSSLNLVRPPKFISIDVNFS